MAKEYHYNEKIHFVDTICSSFLPEDQGTIIDTLTKNKAVGVVSGFYDDGFPVRFISNFMLANLGYSFEKFYELTKGSFDKLVYPKDMALFAAPIDENDEHEREFRLINAEGKLTWVSESRQEIFSPEGKKIWICSYRIIDEARKREAHILNALGSDYDTVLYVDIENCKYHLLIGSPENLHYSAANDGDTKEFLIFFKKYLTDFVPPDEAQLWQLYYSLTDIFAGRDMKNTRQEVTYRKLVNGKAIWMQIRVIFASGVMQDTRYLVMAFRNVNGTMLRELERNQLLSTSLERARRASRARKDFLSKMSHDLRTPLNAIIGMTKLAESNADNHHKMKEYLSIVEASSNHLLQLVDEILDFNQIENDEMIIKPRLINLQKLAKEVGGIIMPLYEGKGQTLHLDMEQVTHFEVVADFDALVKICANLLSNASKYSPNNTSVLVTVREENVLGKKRASYILSVKDCGTGIHKEMLPHIFEPFERVEDTRTSKVPDVGLGLSITKSLVEMMQGEISVNSEYGVGSEFIVKLGLKLKAETATSIEEHEEEPDISGMHAMLVEDNDLSRQIATELLEEEGVMVETAVNGTEAVRLFSEREPNYYDVILMDIQMPIMNGYDATKSIRNMAERNGDIIPIIAVTADAFEEDVQLALHAGMNAHLKKPLDFDALKILMAKMRKK